VVNMIILYLLIGLVVLLGATYLVSHRFRKIIKNNKKKFIAILASILASSSLMIYLTPSPPSYNFGNWMIEGNSVFVNDTRVYIKAIPHTLNKSGYVTFEFKSKVYTGDIDICFGFNRSVIKPTWKYIQKEGWGSKVIKNVVSYTNLGMDNYDNHSVDWGNKNNTKLYKINYELDNGTIKTVICAFTIPIQNGNDYTLIGNYNYWKSLDFSINHISFNFRDMTDWYFIKNIPIKSNKLYKIRIYISRVITDPFKDAGTIEGKYWIALKPSSESLATAIYNNHLYALDPWYTIKTGITNLYATGGLPNSPHLTVDSNRKLHMVFLDSNDDIWYANSTDNGQTWNSQLIEDHASMINRATILIDSTDKIHIFWSTRNVGATGYLRYTNSSDGGSTFATPKTIISTGWPSPSDVCAAIDSNDKIHLVFTYGGRTRYMNSTDYGDTWSSEYMLQSSTSDGKEPVINVDSNDYLHVVYRLETNSYQIYYKKSTNSGVSFGNEMLISNDPGYGQGGDDICIDSNDNLHVSYYGTSSSSANQEIKYCNSTDGGSTFSTPIVITSETYNQREASISCDKNNVVHIIWSGNYSGMDTYQLRYVNSTNFNNIINLTNAGDGQRCPSLTFAYHPSSFNITPDAGYEYVWTDTDNSSVRYGYSGDFERGNAVPIQSNPYPSNGATYVVTQPVCHIDIQDAEGDTMDITFASNYSGSWTNYQTNSSVGNGTYYWHFTGASSYSTKYWWKVFADDGHTNTSSIYSFTTQSQYCPSAPTSFTATTYTNKQINLTWNKGTNDEYVIIERNTSSSWNRGEGSEIYNGTGTSYSDSGLTPATTYYYQAWSYNSTDNIYSQSYASDSNCTCLSLYENIEIYSDFTVCPGTYNLNDAGEGNGSVHLMNSNIVLDLNGATIVGVETGGSKFIFFDGTIDNITIKNGIIKDYNHGLYSAYGDYPSNITLYNLSLISSIYGTYITPSAGADFNITKCNISDNKYRGLYLGDIDRVKISDCNISSNDEYNTWNYPGLYLLSCTAVNVSNCTFLSNDVGILVRSSSSNVTIYDCNISKSQYEYGIRIEDSATKVYVEKCKLYDNKGKGIYLNQVDYVCINDTYIENTSSDPYEQFGIYAYICDNINLNNVTSNGHTTTSGNPGFGVELNTNCTWCNISSCTFRNNSEGITLYHSQNVTVDNTTVDNSTSYGIILEQSFTENTTIKDCHIINSLETVMISNAVRNTINNLTEDLYSGSSYGVTVTGDYNTIENLTAREFGGSFDCITVSGGDNNTFKNIDITDARVEMELLAGDVPKDNKFYNISTFATTPVDILLNDGNIKFNYTHENSVWLETYTATASSFYRNLTDWTTTKVAWTDNFSSSETVTYNLYGLAASTMYRIKDNSNYIDNKTTDSNGYLTFSTTISGKHNLQVIQNQAPTASGESPANNSDGSVLQPTLSVTCSDSSGDIITAYWYSNSSGSWVQFGVNNSVSSGTTISQTNNNFSSYGTRYWWSVNLTDGDLWNNYTFNFKTKTAYTESVRKSGIDYFVWLGLNCSASDVAANITGFDESSEYIAIWDRGSWDTTYGNWVLYFGDGSGTDFSIYTLDVVMIYLTDGSGTVSITMYENSDIDYFSSKTYVWVNTSVNKGYNYSAYNKNTSTSLSAINASVTLQPGEAIGLWNDTTYTWDWWIPGFYEVNKAVDQWDVIISKVENTETWIT